MLISKKTLLWLVLIIILIFSTSVVVLSLFENIPPTEALYRTVYISISHHDAFDMQDWIGRAVVISLIVSSLVIIAYLLKTIGEYIINIGDGLNRNKVKAKLVNMKDHYIICGLGRVGHNIAKELALEGVKFVGIDSDPERVKNAIARGYTAFVGDATQDEVLKKAKVDRARGLVASLGQDSNNLFVTLSARQQNPDLYIVSRSNHSENVAHMQRAGADKVAQPNQIGGFHMATMLTRPGVVDYLEIISKNHAGELEIEEIIVAKHSKVVGDKLGQLLKESDYSVTVLAINTVEGKSVVSPPAHTRINAGDKLIVMGKTDQLAGLGKII